MATTPRLPLLSTATEGADAPTAYDKALHLRLTQVLAAHGNALDDKIGSVIEDPIFWMIAD